MRRKLNRIENKRGFTLIELIAVIFIMGIMLILALPQVSKIQQANKNRKYETYELSIERGAKLYTDSNAKDMFGNNNSGVMLSRILEIVKLLVLVMQKLMFKLERLMMIIVMM